MIPIPNSKPKATRETVVAAATRRWIADGHTEPLPASFFFASRAYYSTTIGKPGNDIQAYDDAGFLVTPTTFQSWNLNTDPSRYGWSPTAADYMARLAPGVHWMRQRIHRGKYQAFGQDGRNVTIDRVKADGTVDHRETGSFGIDLHPGGNSTTSSLGCQTVPPDQWDNLNFKVKQAFGHDWFPYILSEESIS